MLRWCDYLLRAASPLVPHDIRRDWLREWRAEFAYTAARAARLNKPVPIGSLLRACGAIAHAAWLRWDQWRVEMFWQDLKHALRALAAKPGFTVVTLLTLAIGIGGTTAIFGAVNAVLLRPLPYPQPDELVRVYKTPLKEPERIGGALVGAAGQQAVHHSHGAPFPLLPGLGAECHIEETLAEGVGLGSAIHQHGVQRCGAAEVASVCGSLVPCCCAFFRRRFRPS